MLTMSDLEIMQVLSNFLNIVFTVENHHSNIPPMGMRCHTSITTLDINEKTVLKLTNLDISKSPVPDSMHSRILNECADSLTVPPTI